MVEDVKRLVGYDAYRQTRGGDSVKGIVVDFILTDDTGMLYPSSIKVNETYWKCFLEPRIKDYHGRVSVSFEKNGIGQKLELLDLSDEERNPLFPYKNFEDRIRTLEEEVADLRRQHAPINTEGFDMTRNYGSSDDPK